MDSVAEEGSLATVSVRFEGASSSPGMTGIVWTVLLNVVSQVYCEMVVSIERLIRMFMRNIIAG